MKPQRNEIIIWFDTPPKVSKGAFNYLSQNWGEKVYYVCNEDYPEYRKRVNWDDGDFGNADVIYLDNGVDKVNTICALFNEHPNAIHILSGFNNGIEKLVRQYVLSLSKHLVIFSERPVEIGCILERWARLIFIRIKYSYFYHLYHNRTNVLLPLGLKGVTTFAKYGWPQKQMMPFMYNPMGGLIDTAFLDSKEKRGAVRFLYVGRFYYKTKGVDVLMKAVQYLKGQWSLDLVGGYGKKADEVKLWIESLDNVSFQGSWPSQEVSHRMSDYDVVIVPSKYDGWNLLVNEAINAGIGVIVSDQAVSDEVIKFGHAGTVFRSNKPRELAKAMQTVIDNPSIINVWHVNAIATSRSISPASVGDYLINILDYFVYGIGERPSCPWINHN